MPERWQTPLAEVAGTPMTDGLLEEARRGPRHPMPGPSNATRVVIAVVSLAIAAAAGTFLLRAFAGQDDVPMGRTYTSETLGWSMDVPDGWSVLPRGEWEDRGTFRDLGEIWLVNDSAASLDRETIATPEEFEAGLPADGVVVIVNPGFEGSTHVDDFGMPPVLGEPEFPGPDAYAKWQANTMGFEALAWYGDAATDGDRRAAEASVATFTIQPLPIPPEGTTARYGGFAFVLGPEDRFPTGSVERVEVDDPEMPTRAFFVVVTDDDRYAFDASVSTCNLEWDGELFVCPDDGRAWDIDGRSATGPKTFLERMSVVRTWDGQLVINTAAKR